MGWGFFYWYQCYFRHTDLIIKPMVVIFFSVLQVVVSECEPGWIAYKDQCYLISTLRYNRRDADDFCGRRNATIWIYKSAEERVSKIDLDLCDHLNF